VAKPKDIELPTGERIPILYEDRSVLAIDKPRGWMLVPFSWQHTGRNLQAALASSMAARALGRPEAAHDVCREVVRRVARAEAHG
jgi:23S rRNA-/tRNA-specific pseudouridylate synthase